MKAKKIKSTWNLKKKKVLKMQGFYMFLLSCHFLNSTTSAVVIYRIRMFKPADGKFRH